MNTAEEILRKRKLRLTPNRVDLLQLIIDFSKAIPVSRINEAFPDADRITLYRTLKTLTEKGIIHSTSFKNDETYYAICSHKCSETAHNHNHIHFKCTSCNSVSCEKIENDIKVELNNYIVSEININVKGICSQCR